MLNAIVIYDSDLSKIRLGSSQDGGYVLLDEIAFGTTHLLSYGIGDDVTFEEAFCDRYSCDALLYDHTIDGSATMSDRLQFFREGVAASPAPGFRSIQEHVAERTADDRLTLKMDVEWAEWDVLDSIRQATLMRFDQIVCEFHFMRVQYEGQSSPYFANFHRSFYGRVNEMLFNKYEAVIRRLQEDFYVFHVHANNSLPPYALDQGQFPPLIEMSLVRKDLVTTPVVSRRVFPDPLLDRPNKSDRPDIDGIEWNKYA